MKPITLAVIALLLAPSLAPALRAQLPLRHVSHGSQLFQGYGSAIARTADRDDDGIEELLVGSPDLGRVDIISGRSGAIITTLVGPAPFEGFGTAVADLGDIDGDGEHDIGIGAPGHDLNGGDCGRVLVYSGANLAIIRDLAGDFAGDLLGSTLLAWPDLDGDGLNEFVAGAPGTTAPGYVRLYGDDGATLSSFWGQTPGGGTGESLARVPDLDGDGLDELAVGAPRADFGPLLGCGRVTVIAGNGLAILLDLGGALLDDSFGAALAAFPDLDGDGLADLLVGAPGSDLGGPEAGALFVFSSASGVVIRSHVGAEPFALFGNAATVLGDADGDGQDDYAVGAWFEDAPFLDSGALRVFSGASGSLVLERGGDGSGARLGARLSALGDVDGDGFVEVAGAAPASSGGTIFGGAVEVLSVGGFRGYGASGFTPGLSLRFVPGGAPSLGVLAIAGAAAWSPGLLAVSLYPAAVDLGFLTLLVNPDPSLLVVQGQYGHDAAGEAQFLVDASQPFLAGVSLWLQAFDLAFPYGASNGLEMRCLP